MSVVIGNFQKVASKSKQKFWLSRCAVGVKSDCARLIDKRITRKEIGELHMVEIGSIFRIHPTTYRPIDIYQVSTRETILETIELSSNVTRTRLAQSADFSWQLHRISTCTSRIPSTLGTRIQLTESTMHKLIIPMIQYAL